MADAATQSLAQFLDKDKWDEILDDVPVFVPHAAYCKQNSEGKYDWKIVPLGSKSPGEGWEHAYDVTEDTLKEIVRNINTNLEENGKVVKLFEGHTFPASKVAQKDQPGLLGFGVGAKFGNFGPKKKPAVLLKKMFIAKGCGDRAKELPERSSEYNWGTRDISSVALIKTEPRLAMGMTIYHDPRAKLVCYAQGVDDMPDPVKMPPSAAEERAKMDNKPEEEDDSEQEIDTKNPQDAEDAKHFARHMAHYMKTCGHKMVKYMADASAPASGGGGNGGPAMAPSPTNGQMPAMAREEEKKRPPETTPMAQPGESDTIRFMREQYQADQEKNANRLKALEQRDLRRSCEGFVKDLIYKGKNLGNPVEQEKLVVKLMAMPTENDRTDYCQEIERNWLDDPASPGPGSTVGYGYGDVLQGPTTLQGPQPTSQEAGEIAMYCEANKLDVDSDEGWRAGYEAVMKKRNARRSA